MPLISKQLPLYTTQYWHMFSYQAVAGDAAWLSAVDEAAEGRSTSCRRGASASSRPV